MGKTGIFDNLTVDPEKIFGKKSWQQLALLELKGGFIKEFRALQKRWSNEIKESQKITIKLIALLEKNPKVCGKNPEEFVKHFKKNPDYCLESAAMLAPIPKENINEICHYAREYLRLKRNNQIENEITNLVRKYKLLSFNFSFTALMTAFYKDSFPFVFYDIYRDLREKIWRCIPVDAQFALGMDRPLYPFDRESKLVIYLDDNCGLADIKKYWGIVSKKLKELKKMKGVEKRYYPLKKIPTVRKIKDERKKRMKYYNEKTGKWKIIKPSYETIAEELYDETSLGSKKEERNKNKIKQLDHRYKKILK